MYHLLLLYGPALYENRVSQALQDIEAIKPSIVAFYSGAQPNLKPLEGDIQGFKASWSEFLGSLVREWETFNIVTTLLLACVPF
jgi:hypothetical protein